MHNQTITFGLKGLSRLACALLALPLLVGSGCVQPDEINRVQPNLIKKSDLTGEWYGWRVRGRYLVSADGQRIPQERLRGLLFRDANELRLAGFESRRKAEANAQRKRGFKVKVIVIDMCDYRANGLAVG